MHRFPVNLWFPLCSQLAPHVLTGSSHWASSWKKLLHINLQIIHLEINSARELWYIPLIPTDRLADAVPSSSGDHFKLPLQLQIKSISQDHLFVSNNIHFILLHYYLHKVIRAWKTQLNVKCFVFNDTQCR